MDLEIDTVNEVRSQSDREEEISYDIPYTENLKKKNDTNEHIYRKETNITHFQNEFMVAGGKDEGKQH